MLVSMAVPAILIQTDELHMAYLVLGLQLSQCSRGVLTLNEQTFHISVEQPSPAQPSLAQVRSFLPDTAHPRWIQ